MIPRCDFSPAPKDDIVTCDEARAIVMGDTPRGLTLLRFIDQAEALQKSSIPYEHGVRLLDENARLRAACEAALTQVAPNTYAGLTLREALGGDK